MKVRHKFVIILSLFLFLTMASTIDLYAAASKSTATPTISSINIEPYTYRKLFLGETLQLTAMGTYPDGSAADISSQVEWSISNTTDLSISESGLLTVISKGNAAMSAAPGGPSGPGEVDFIVTAALSGIAGPPLNLTALTSEGPSVYLQSGGNAENSSQSIYGTNTNQSGVKVTDRGVFSISDSTVTTTGDSTFAGDSSSYGLNAGVLATSGSKIKITNSTVTTGGIGANIIFAYGKGSVVELSNVKLKSTGAGAHGVDCTYTGEIIIEDSYIHTFGPMGCASLANDTGDGNVAATRIKTITEGDYSPGFYAIGANSIFRITDSQLLAKVSEGGLLTTGVTVYTYNSTLKGNVAGVSLSKGSTLTMVGGGVEATGGPGFVVEGGPGVGRHDLSKVDTSVFGSAGSPVGGVQDGGVPGGGQTGGPGGGPPQGAGAPGGPGGDLAQGPSENPMGEGMRGPNGEPAATLPTSNESHIIVKGGVKIVASSGNIVYVKEASKATFTAEEEELIGNIFVEEGCGLDVTLRNSTLTGKIQGASITIEAGSTWNVTGDSTLTGINIKDDISGKTAKNIIGNGYTVYYDKSASKELEGKTYKLTKGGKLTPKR